MSNKNYGRRKRCAHCHELKGVRAFRRNGRYLQAYCKTCATEVQRAYVARNAGRLQAYTVRYATRNQRLLDELRTRPCADCGNTFPPYVMDFDHLPGVTKVAKVSAMARAQYSEETIRAEAAKCEVVCANCHRIRTYRRAHPGGARG